MAACWNKTTKEYRKSVHTPDVAADPNFVVFDGTRNNADRDALLAGGVPARYWKLSGDQVVAMDATEKAAQDAAELAAAAAAATAMCQAAIAAVKGSPAPDPTASAEDRIRALERAVFGA